MPDSAFTAAEKTLLRELLSRGVKFMVVGMSGALIQGARGATDDIDLWFEDPNDPRVREAVHAAGGVWVSGSFGMTQPRIGGEALGDRFDVVVTMSGLGSYSEEQSNIRYEIVDDIRLPVLSLERIAESKRAAARPKDRAALSSIEDALAVLAAEKK